MPCGPINTYPEALSDPQTLARAMVVDLVHPGAGPIKALGVPVKLSETPGAVDIRIMVTKDPGRDRDPSHPGFDRIMRAAVKYDILVNFLFWGNLDAGTALALDGDYFGRTVNMAARIDTVLMTSDRRAPQSRRERMSRP